MDHQTHLDMLIKHAGSLEDIKWGTLYDEKMTLGTMTDQHVDNCIQYHEGMVMMAEVTPHLLHQLDDCRFIVYMMKENKRQREETNGSVI